MPFQETFGGQVLLPADLTYLALTISTDVELVWPLEQQVGGNLVVADIIDLSAGNPGLNVDMPDATIVGPGTSVLFNNVGAQTVTVRDQAGATIISLASGTTWMIYLRDNQTPAGAWRTFQFGASVSVANAAALAGAGLKAIGATLNTRIPVSPKNTNYTILDSDRAVALVWTSGVGQFDLPNAATAGADWYCIVRNSGNGDLTVIPPSGTIDGAASQTFPAGSSSFVVSDGLNYFTVGFGTGAGGGGSGFDFVTINVAGLGDYVLSGAELGRVGYRFTGVLTGTRNIVVPGSTDEYWVDNQTTGAFSLFVKTLAQVPGIEVLQNNRNILYCDGTNVVSAESATVSFPIPVAQGGTGAINAAAARTNLGSGAVGDAIFVAANQASAQTALGITLAGSNTWAAQDIWTAQGTHAIPTMQLSSDRPILQLNETDAAADNRRWSIEANSEALQLSAANDAGSVASVWLTVNRTGTTIDGINFPLGILQYGGFEVGYKGLIVRNFSGSDNTISSDNGRLVRYQGIGGHTFTLDGDLPLGTGMVMIMNGGSGNLTISASTLGWYNGSGTVTTGNRTLAVGGVVAAWYGDAGPNYSLWGTGLS